MPHNDQEQEVSVNFHEPFSPVIMETQVPKRFIDIVNCIQQEFDRISF